MAKRVVHDMETANRELDFMSCELVNDCDVSKWKAKINGPKDTPYEGGTFGIYIEFPHNYPLKPPTCKFTTPIFHSNIQLHDTMTYNQRMLASSMSRPFGGCGAICMVSCLI